MEIAAIMELSQKDRISFSATLAIAAGVAAAWIAAGASGMLAHSLRQILTCLLLGTAAIAVWPSQAKELKDGSIFAGGVIIAMFLAVFPWEAVNILAIVILLATLAHLRGGLDGRAIFVAAAAAMCFAVCHLLLFFEPRYSVVGDRIGQSLGWLAGKMTGRQLSVGATFGGVDFLLLMVFLYGLWLYHTASPRKSRAIYGGLAIIAAQFAYLVVLAFSEKILAVLPAPIHVIEDDYLRVGAWVWQNSVRAMIPWNLPLPALLLQTLVAAAMFRFASWPIEPAAETELISKAPRKSRNQPTPAQYQSPATKNRQAGFLLNFGPSAAAIFLAISTMLWTTKPDLGGKTVVAYPSSNVSWSLPQQGKDAERGYGLLQDYLRCMGGNFAFSRDLAAEELAKADVVLLLDKDAQFTVEQQSRLDAFVAHGGSLLTTSEIAGVTGNRVANWEQSSLAMNHPATLGIDDFRNGLGLESGSLLSPPDNAYPLVVGKWGWNSSDKSEKSDKSTNARYQAGDRLGDLALIAETSRGDGKIIFLGDRRCLSNDMLPLSYEFVGRMFGYLAEKTPTRTLWRTGGTLFFAAVLLAFILVLKKPLQLATLTIVFAAAILLCRTATLGSQQIVLRENAKSSHRLALIDASHVEAYSDALWSPLPKTEEFVGKDWRDSGLGKFARILACNGYLPLRLKHWSSEQLDRGSLFVSMAPARCYSAEQSEALRAFVTDGGTLLVIAGAEESRPINPLLDAFNLRVPHSPVSPNDNAVEPRPNGSLQGSYGNSNDGKEEIVHLFAAWQIDSLALGSPEEKLEAEVSREENNFPKWLIASRRWGSGFIAVIADTYFAANKNPDPALKADEHNDRFWQWYLPEITNPERSIKTHSPEKSPKKSPEMPDEDPLRENGPDEG